MKNKETSMIWSEKLTHISNNPKTWLITGVAGFIGSNLLEFLLEHKQTVVGVDNFATGKLENLNEVKQSLDPKNWRRFQFIEGDVKNIETCREACNGVDYVLHQAARGSVAKSLLDPHITDINNVNGFVNMLLAAKDSKVNKLVYASSSSVYGDSPILPKKEIVIGNCLSPYAVSKLTNELYSSVFKKNYDFNSTGLRYFNVFGKRQDPYGDYSAVIPKWLGKMLQNEDVIINGDGSTSRDFCFIENVIQANILAALSLNTNTAPVYNVAYGARTTLVELLEVLTDKLKTEGMIYNKAPIFGDFRAGDVQHSLADISRAKAELGYNPTASLTEGLSQTMGWYIDKFNGSIKNAKL